LNTAKESLDRLALVETTNDDRTEAPACVHSSINVASLAPNHDNQVAHHSQPKPLAINAVMSDHEEEDVARATRAVRAAYDALQALRASRHLKIPSSLYNAGAALNRILYNLEVLTESTEALSIFRAYTVKEASNSVGASLSDAIVHDMGETETCFEAMKPVGPSRITDDLDKQKCRNIKEMVDQYETIISMVLSKHKECVSNESTYCACLADLL
jgi:hypothetical protein